MRIGSILTLPSLTYLVDIGKIEEKLDLTSYSHRDSNLYSLVQSDIRFYSLPISSMTTRYGKEVESSFSPDATHWPLECNINLISD